MLAISVLSKEGDPLPYIDVIQLHSAGVVDLLSNINHRKSHDPDNLPAQVISSETVPTFSLIF